MNKVWVKFWKVINRKSSDGGTDYFLFDKEYANDENMQMEAHDWAEKQPGGESYGYRDYFEIIDLPPIEWLKKEEERIEGERKYLIERMGYVIKSICEIEEVEWREVSMKVFGEGAPEGAMDQTRANTLWDKEFLRIPKKYNYTRGAYIRGKGDIRYCFDDDLKLIGTSDTKTFTPMTIKDFRKNG